MIGVPSCPAGARLRLHGCGAREVDPVLMVGSLVAPHHDRPSVRANSL